MNNYKVKVITENSGSALEKELQKFISENIKEGNLIDIKYQIVVSCYYTYSVLITYKGN